MDQHGTVQPPSSPAAGAPLQGSNTPATPPGSADQPFAGSEGDLALAATLERIGSKFAEIRTLQTTRSRRGICIILLIFFAAVWFLSQILDPIRQIYSDPKFFLSAIQHEEQSTFWPVIRMELQKAGPAVYSAFDTAFQAEWEKRHPRVQGLINEVNLLSSHVTRYMGQQGDLRVQNFLERYQRKLETDFPEIARDPEALEIIHEALGSALTTVIGTRFQRPFETFCTISDNFQALPVPDSYHKLSDLQLQEALLELITAYLNQRFKPVLDNLRLVRDHLLGLEDQFMDGIQALESKLPPLNVNPATK